MQNLYSKINAEVLFSAGNPGLSKIYTMNEMDLEKELLALPYDEDEEKEDDDEDEDDEDEDEDLDEDEIDVNEDIDIDEDEEGDLDDLDEDDDEEDEAEEDLASSTVAARSEAAALPAGAGPRMDKEALAAAGLNFNCYICEEPSGEICARCTRDTCDNHICERCLLCSDCCTCDGTLR